MKELELKNERKEYEKDYLLESNAPDNPFVLFAQWFKEWSDTGRPDTTAMTLATVGKDGEPDARIVLLKELKDRRFSFFTNYNSKKGRDLEANPSACLMFFWPDHERQVRVYGSVEKLSYEENADYFNQRPAGSRIGALSSPQSSVIEGREYLEKAVETNTKEFGEDGPECPPYWGGYAVVPHRIEFWQGRPSRLHDRLQYRLQSGSWIIERLAP